MCGVYSCPVPPTSTQQSQKVKLLLEQTPGDAETAHVVSSACQLACKQFTN